jgi:ribosomal protein S18 acetylase RimI-like enzyme
MTIVPVDESHLVTMMDWFPDADACLVWGGAQFAFPFTAESFRRDSRVDELPSFALLDDAGDFVGFGQYYRRNGRCHLARLAVSPAHRGRGYGTALVESLSRRAHEAFGMNEYSLFVLEHNVDARRLYTRLGFAPAPYPETLPPDHVYMVRRGLA